MKEEGHAYLVGYDGAWDLQRFGDAILDCAHWVAFRPKYSDPRECRRIVKALRTVKENFGFLLRDNEDQFKRVLSLYESNPANRQGGRPVNTTGDILRGELAKRFVQPKHVKKSEKIMVIVNHKAVAALFRATFPQSKATERSVAVQLAGKLPK
jgi:hypothetical protein